MDERGKGIINNSNVIYMNIEENPVISAGKRMGFKILFRVVLAVVLLTISIPLMFLTNGNVGNFGFILFLFTSTTCLMLLGYILFIKKEK